MAEAQKSKVNFLQDIALPVFAFLSSAYSPQGAVAAQALTSAMGVGQRRRAGERKDERLAQIVNFRQQEAAQAQQQAKLERPARELEAAQAGFQLDNLADIQSLIGAPAPTPDTVQALGVPQVARLQEALGRGEQAPLPLEAPSPQVRQQRFQELATSPGGTAQLAAAGLEDVAQRTQALLPDQEDPRQFAQDKREALGIIRKFPQGQITPESAKQLRSQITQARTQADLTDAVAAIPLSAGAPEGSIEEQVYHELAPQIGPLEALKSISGAQREPPDPLEQQEKQLRIQKLQTDITKAKDKGISNKERIDIKSKVRTTLRGEEVYKDYNDVLTGYTRVKIGTKMGEGPGDLAIVNGTVRLLDPNSVVRPSEFQTAANAQGWLDWAKSWAGRVESGAILSPETRQRFLNLAEQVHQSHANRLTQEVGTVYGNMLKDTGISLDELFVQPQVSAAPEASGQTVNIGAPPPLDATPTALTPETPAPSAFTIKSIREKGS